jgi:hypothetical protein
MNTEEHNLAGGRGQRTNTFILGKEAALQNIPVVQKRRGREKLKAATITSLMEIHLVLF